MFKYQSYLSITPPRDLQSNESKKSLSLMDVSHHCSKYEYIIDQYILKKKLNLSFCLQLECTRIFLIHENNPNCYIAAISSSLVKIIILSRAHMATPYGTYVHGYTPQVYNKDV